MQRIDGAVNNVLARLGLKEDIKRLQIVGAWEEFVGEELALRSRAVRVSGTVLWVEVTAPVWGQQISLHKYQLLSRIGRTFGYGLIKDIRTFLANTPFPDQPGGSPRQGEVKRWRLEIRPEHRQKAELITQDITDEKLKKSMQGVVARGLAREEWKRERGWLSCSKCGALYPSLVEETCFICRDKEQANRVERLKLLLMQVPWYSYQEAVGDLDNLTQEEYRAVKEVIAATWESAASRLKWSSPDKVLYVKRMLEMLKKGVRPEDLSLDLGEKGKPRGRL